MDPMVRILSLGICLLLAFSVLEVKSAPAKEEDADIVKLVRGGLVKDVDGGEQRVIMYGTSNRWCGQRNDIGSTKNVDSCCKEQNECALKIHADKQRWGVRNIVGHTLVDCKCQDKFSDCLKKVKGKNTGRKEQALGEAIERMYFSVIGVPCVVVPDGVDSSEPEIGINEKRKNEEGSPAYLRLHRPGESTSNSFIALPRMG